MRDYKFNFEVGEERYPMIFNLNVMEAIQEEFGTVAKWGELTDAKNGEPNAKAIKFGITAMMNEARDIENENLKEPLPMLTEKEVGRIITRAGLQNSAEALNRAVIDATKEDTEKNA